MPRDETTHVSSGKKMSLILLLKSLGVNVSVLSWLSDFTMGKETS